MECAGGVHAEDPRRAVGRLALSAWPARFFVTIFLTACFSS